MPDNAGLFEMLDAPAGVVHAAVSNLAIDGASVRDDRVAAATQAARLVGLSDAAVCNQVHGARVICAETPGLAGDADALITATPDLGVCVLGADCPLVLLADVHGRAVGAAHASWRGTLAEVTAATVTAMRDQLGIDPADLVVGICPSAGPRCYEVGGEVLDAFVSAQGLGAQRFFRFQPGSDRVLLDLWSANRDQLIELGVPRASIRTSGVCTICSGGDHWPSYRRDGAAAGRYLAMIGLCDTRPA